MTEHSRHRRSHAFALILMMSTALLALSACGRATAPAHDQAADATAIRHVLDEIASTFNAGDYDGMFALYADDVLVSAPGQPEIVGKDAWRAGLAKLPQGVTLRMRFDTQELEVSGDLGYERGTFTMDVFDKPGGTKLTSVTNRHVHVFKRSADGHWLGWRLMENSADAPPLIPAAAPPPK
jgi:uncharacterized protein (TIGR02246 family)